MGANGVTDNITDLNRERLFGILGAIWGDGRVFDECHIGTTITDYPALLAALGPLRPVTKQQPAWMQKGTRMLTPAAERRVGRWLSDNAGCEAAGWRLANDMGWCRMQRAE